MANLVGQQVQQYQIEALLGQGSMGSVYEALDLNLARSVAIKVVEAHLARQPDFRGRFLQEAQATAQLDHPAIIKVFDFRSEDDLLYMVMEHVPLGSLTAQLRRMEYKKEPLEREGALRLVSEIADALDYAHGQGLIHRDVKPDNILLKTNGATNRWHGVLTDFGLAALRGEETEAISGSLPYMSPEQLQGLPADSRSDLYSLGIVLFQLLTGQLPFEISTMEDAHWHHTETEPPAPSEINPEIPLDLEVIVLRAIAKNPDERYQTGKELVAALEPHVGPLQLAAVARSTPESQSSRTMLPVPVNVQEWQTTSETLDQMTIRNAAALSQAAPDIDQITVSQAAPQTHTLNEEIITIGRSDENDVVLTHENVSLRHASLKRTVEGSWQVIDLGSKNGVYIDGTPLLPHVAESWYPNQTMRIGPFYFTLRPAGTVTSSQDGRTTISLLLTPGSVSLLPGEMAEVEVVLVNAAKERRYIQINLTELPSAWYTIPQDALRLMPGERGQLRVLLHPPEGSGTRSGEYRFQVIARTISGEEEQAAATGTLTVKAVEGYTVNVQPLQFSSEGVCRVRISNRGNQDMVFSVKGSNGADLVRFGVEEVEIAHDGDVSAFEEPAAEGPSAAARIKGASKQASGLLRIATMLPFLRRVPFVQQSLRAQSQTRMYTSAGRQAQRMGGQRPPSSAPKTSKPAGSAMQPATPTVRYTGRFTNDTRLFTYVMVPAGRVETLDVAIEAAAKPLFGRGDKYNFTINTSPRGEDVVETATGSLQVSPTIPMWLSSGVIVALLFFCLVGAAFVVARNYQPGGRDTDRDRLTNVAEEEQYFTDPDNPDTDMDGVLDGDEVRLGLDPLKADTDGDSLSDGEEVEIGSNPTMIDTDGDTIPDGVEVLETKTNPLEADSNGDGLTDRQELLLASDTNVWERPATPTAVPVATIAARPTAEPDATPVTRADVFMSIGSQDGSIAEAGQSNVGGEVFANEAIFEVGVEGITRRQFKGLVSFDTSSIPRDAEIVSIQIRLRRVNAVGQPYQRLGQLHMDIGPPTGFSRDPSLQASDFEAADVATNVLVFEDALADGEWVEGILEREFFVYMNRNGFTQFRIYYTLTGDQNEEDSFIWFSGGNDANSNFHPQLLVTYQIVEAVEATD